MISYLFHRLRAAVLRATGLRPPKRKPLVRVAFMVGLSALTGCSKGMTPASSVMAATSPATGFAFVANLGSGTVAAFAISTSGGLSTIPGSPFAAGAGAEFMAFDPTHKILFVGNANSNNLSAFNVNTQSGVLSSLPGSPFATGVTPHGV